jgi:CBS domain-containing protein
MSRMAAYHIGCLAMTNKTGDIIGVVSERDYLCKVALLGRNSRECLVSSIATHGEANLVVANNTDDIETCLEKVLAKDIRHLLIRDEATGKLTGLLSIKDLVKVVVEIQRSRIAALREISIGGLSKRENMLNHEI